MFRTPATAQFRAQSAGLNSHPFFQRNLNNKKSLSFATSKLQPFHSTAKRNDVISFKLADIGEVRQRKKETQKPLGENNKEENSEQNKEFLFLKKKREKKKKKKMFQKSIFLMQKNE